jgi:hypothetical protein
VSGGFFGGFVLSRTTVMLVLVAIWVALTAALSVTVVFVY